ncbi:MAG TPA: hypothetical protein VJO35_04020 [Terriglobales bacterium]|nr:hypothetical protein [Terriglobales bacterium]
MYLRFVVSEIDEDSERALGVFHALGDLRDAGKLYSHEEEQHDTVRWWFSANLERPTRFTAAKAPFCRKKHRALCWFKDTAIIHIAQIRELVWMLESHSVYVRTLKAKRVGYVVYEDEYQIVAEPFAENVLLAAGVLLRTEGGGPIRPPGLIQPIP